MPDRGPPQQDPWTTHTPHNNTLSTQGPTLSSTAPRPTTQPATTPCDRDAAAPPPPATGLKTAPEAAALEPAPQPQPPTCSASGDTSPDTSPGDSDREDPPQFGMALRNLFTACTADPAAGLCMRQMEPLMKSLSLADFGYVRGYNSGAPWLTFDQFGRQSKVVGCLPCLTKPHVSLTIFVLPPGAHLSLHDHPKMHVLCRVMHGRLHEHSLDWVDGPPAVMADGADAKVVSRGVHDPEGDLMHVSPEGGGVLHEFRAPPDAPVVFCDLITPPYYTPPANTPCTYFRCTPRPLAELTEIGATTRLMPAGSEAEPNMVGLEHSFQPH